MKLLPADATVERMIPLLVEDLPYRGGDEVILVINGYGATTRMEMFIVNRKIRAMLADREIQVYATDIGEFCTTQEMKGLSVTLVKVDDELKRYFDAPCKSPFYVRY